MFYFSAILAITGVIGYQYFIKHVPSSINPIVSILAMYIAVLIFSAALLPLFPCEGGLLKSVRQLNWLQLALAVSVIMVELGFLLMYRYGWQLGMASIITGAFSNTLLVGIGMAVLGEKLSIFKLIGIFLCILGVALISYRP